MEGDGVIWWGVGWIENVLGWGVADVDVTWDGVGVGGSGGGGGGGGDRLIEEARIEYLVKLIEGDEFVDELE